jgi:hypothetical protein
VVGQVANVRAEPSPRARVLFQVRSGDVLRLLDTQGDWLQVETADGRRGYLFKALGEVKAPPPPAAAPPPPPPPPPPTTVLGIEHKEVGCIVRDQYAKLDACFLPADQLGRGQVHFRAGDNDPWYEVELRQEGPCHVAYLPKPLKTTTQVQYYLAAVDTAFNEKQQPETAPPGAYRARVVRNEKDCGGLARLAFAVGKVAKPIVVGVAKTAAGLAVDAAAAQLLGATLAGFSTEGVVLASAAAAGAAGGSGATAGTAGAAGGGGIGMGTLAVVGGIAAAGGIAAVAAGGGGDDGGGDGGGNTPGGGQAPAAIDLSGRWAGTWTETGTGNVDGESFTFNCTVPVTSNLSQSGTAVMGNITYGNFNCNYSIPGFSEAIEAFEGGTYPFNATASAGTLTINFPPIEICAAFAISGPYTATSFNISGRQTCSVDADFVFNTTHTFTANRQ